jgi:hypothetical protein
MRASTTLNSLFFAALLLAAAPAAHAQISPGSCPSAGTATADIDVNNVRATLHNNGNLFYPGSGAPYYEIPKGSGLSSVFASGIWVGGMAGDELRMAAATYSNYEFRPGPLNDQGLPEECNDEFDRIWKISKADIQQYEATGQATSDLQQWPADAGAPVIDGDGNPNNYNLAGGDRPELIGDQTLWWVMNDVAPPHRTTQTPPIGLEAQVQAFAFNQAGVLGNTTFYKYTFEYKGDQILEDVYLGLWADTDLGYAGDDYVGSDPELGMGFTYNGTASDGDYGNPPPSLGYDFFQGPLVSSPGDSIRDPDGTLHVDSTRIAMERFVYYNNDSSPSGNPDNAEDYYGYLRGIWKDGQPITRGGTGRDPSAPRAEFMYPADPPNFWSESQPTPGGESNSPADRRFLQSAGPFTLRPGDTQEIVFGIVWSRVSGAAPNANILSLEKLKRQNALVQQVFDINFRVPDPPAAPNLEATPRDQAVTLTWGYNPQQNNYLGQYRAENTLIPSVPQEESFYEFEGFIVKQFESPSDGEGRILEVFDKDNGITTVLDESATDGTVTIDVEGTDSGLKYSYQATGLTNYKKYYYGVQPYAYNENSTPKIYRGPTERITVQPSQQKAGEGGTVVVEDSLNTTQQADTSQTIGQGTVNVEVVDPTEVTGDKYVVEFESETVLNQDLSDSSTFTIYNIVNTSSSPRDTVFNGSEFLEFSCERTGNFDLSECEEPPTGEAAVQRDGLAFNVLSPEPDFTGFRAIANASGPLDPPATLAPCSVGAWAWPCAETSGLPGDRQQSGSAQFFFHAGGADNGSYEAFISRATRGGSNFAAIGPYDYEMRFTSEGGQAVKAFQGGSFINVPFELWNIGIGTPNDPSDDYRMVPALFDLNDSGTYDVSDDHPISGGEDDPMTDWVYWYTGTDTSPGESGYNAFFADNAGYGDETIARSALVNWNGGSSATVPEEGSVFRITTAKANQPGDTFTFDTESLAPTTDSTEVAEANLDDIAIVPNPYKGVSDYEVSQIVDVAKFINMPDQATVRIYTLSGRLIRTLRKNNSRQMTWDLQTSEDLPIASGMYLIHIDVPDVGERILKFGVVKKSPKLNEL